MNQKNENTGLRLNDWKLWFRLGTIGFLLLLSSKSEGAETVVVSSPEIQVALKKQVVTQKKAGQPTLIVPADQKTSKAKAKVAPKPPTDIPRMPKLIQKKKLVSKKPIPPQRRVRRAAAESEQWTMQITPGVSSNPNVKSESKIITFKLDRKTREVIEPPIQQVLGTSPAVNPQSKTKVIRRVRPKKVEQIEKNKQKNPINKKRPLITSNRQRPPQLPSKKQAVNAADYEQIYSLIPYSRAEYLANPAYRHEAALEILFGEQRPTVIHKQNTPKRIYNMPRLNEAQPRTLQGLMPWGGYYPGYYGGYGY